MDPEPPKIHWMNHDEQLVFVKKHKHIFAKRFKTIDGKRVYDCVSNYYIIHEVYQASINFFAFHFPGTQQWFDECYIGKKPRLDWCINLQYPREVRDVFYNEEYAKLFKNTKKHKAAWKALLCELHSVMACA